MAGAVASELAPIHNAALALLALGGGCALFSPGLFWLLLAGLLGAGVTFLAWRHLVPASAVWLVVTGMTLEMVLSDLIGLPAFQPTIAVIKGTGLLLAVLAVLRYGLLMDVFNPGLPWVVMFITGLAHGLWPDLTAAESLRSLVGSVAPFAFGFSRLSPGWAGRVIRTTRWVPLVAVGFGAALAAAGLHPLFIQSGGARLAGLGHPAFLAGVCQAALYAGLIEFYRDGRQGELALLAVNLLLLLLTGARSPLFCALAVTGLTLALVPSPAVSLRQRRLLILAGLALLPLLALVVLVLPSGDLSALRTLNVLARHWDDLSGRQLLWPRFEAAAALSPWFGWGVGAANAIIPPGSAVADLLHTRAAHNEYLRIAVEGGVTGQLLFVTSMILWVRGHTRRLPAHERWILRLVFLGLAVHAFTDNLLISTPACVLFTFAIAVFARGRFEAAATRRLLQSGGQA